MDVRSSEPLPKQIGWVTHGRIDLHRRLLVLATGLGACGPATLLAQSQRRDDALDESLRESVSRVPVPGTGADIVVTSYRPPGTGPFPWILLSHGTATTREANLQIGRWRNAHLIREWLSRGYAVLVPIRRGYGASGGAFGDGYGSCKRPDFHRAGEGAAADLIASIDWTRPQKDLDPRHWMLVGQSAGGFASIYTASKQPEGLRAVLAFAPGRGGDPDARPGQPCAVAALADTFATLAPRISVPVLWFYAQNDEYIGPVAQRVWFDAFRAAGGKGDLVVIPPFSARRGHGVLPSPQGATHWVPAVRRFLSDHRVGLVF